MLPRGVEVHSRRRAYDFPTGTQVSRPDSPKADGTPGGRRPVACGGGHRVRAEQGGPAHVRNAIWGGCPSRTTRHTTPSPATNHFLGADREQRREPVAA